MANNKQDRKGTRSVSTGPNGAMNPKFKVLLQLGKQQMHNKLVVHHLIAALRALGSLCAEVGNMLDGQSKAGSFAAQGQWTNTWPEVRAASLDPADFIDPEDDQGSAA